MLNLKIKNWPQIAVTYKERSQKTSNVAALYSNIYSLTKIYLDTP